MATADKKYSSSKTAAPECIRLRGVRQNNLKGFDLDLPLGKFIVVTGLSGAGKSSLVFDTLHAEGQRRYVETFSAYTRQFLELLSQPKVDSIENIRPSIAIEQTNTVKNSRSTVGTMTELTDYFKVWFSHVASCFDPATGKQVEDDTPASIWTKVAKAFPGKTLVVAFKVSRPEALTWPEILANLKAQAYVRVLVSKEQDSLYQAHRIEALEANPSLLTSTEKEIFVAQDRLSVGPDTNKRFLEAVETALHFGRGQVHLFSPEKNEGFSRVAHYSQGLHSPESDRIFKPASPALFSFNSPLGACPRCRGFGRIIEVDLKQAIPDRSLSIEQGAIKCWEGEVYSECRRDLLKFSPAQGISTKTPFEKLSAKQQAFILEGEPGFDPENGKDWPEYWYGVKGFFKWLEKNSYKMHVRVFLSRYRSYNLCPECKGTRLQGEALCWQWKGKTLPELYTLPCSELLQLLENETSAPSAKVAQAEASHSPVEIAFAAIVTRLRYLQQVGLDYLSLDRPSKTLSGGEVERVNLTSCLGSSLVDTLFVLDEPSVGLHPRDINRLISIVRSLTLAGNTVVVVEHDEAMIRAADHVLEIGPEPGTRGGHLVFEGKLQELLLANDSITGDYLSGRRSIAIPEKRRPVGDKKGHKKQAWLRIRGATKHNLRNLNVDLPLGRLVCLSGVSGSGKSTLLDHVIHQGLLAARGRLTEDPALIKSLESDLDFSEIVLVDQSPLSRTPRSNPALYTDTWGLIRKLYADTAEAKAAGFNDSSFSFNSGEGRCDHCQGLGFERVEMQFLSDVFVPCPLCEGKRFKEEVLAIQWEGKSVADLLQTPVSEALPLFSAKPEISRRLGLLEEVGLGYLTLGQPLNTLSGGEAQRLKLVSYLDEVADVGSGALLLLDEPTTGLHRHDVARLLKVLHTLVDRGHSIVVIEHNLDVLKSADWLVEVGPEGGPAGGRIVGEGTPETLADSNTQTAPWLRDALYPSPQLIAAEEDTASQSPLPEEAAAMLRVRGARENNLANISLDIPHRQLSVVTGVSGSGKSTLAFDIIFAEGQRRFMESMSPYARQFVEQLPRPDIDALTGIPPTVAIEQRVTRGSRKSTVATITEVAQYLRLLYARTGVQHHPDSDNPVQALSASALRKLLDKTLSLPVAAKAPHLYLCAPLIRGRKGHHQPIATWLSKQGYSLMRIDGKLVSIEAFTKLDRYKEHDIEAVVADLGVKGGNLPRAHELLTQAMSLGKGSCFLLLASGKVLSWFSTSRTDAQTGESFPELEPKHFSHNSPRGWCPACRGHGRIYPWMLEKAKKDGDEDQQVLLRSFGIEESDEGSNQGAPCPDCGGTRLNRISRAVKLHFKGRHLPASLPDLLALPSMELVNRLHCLELDERGRMIAGDIIPQIEERLRFLSQVGLSYLSLDRATATLSGGEAQRIRLAAQLGSNLAGVLYVLDEPSIGLHARDNERLIETLLSLRDRGNTLLVVEHDDDLMLKADRLIDLGPGAGIHGGHILAEGSPEEVRRNDSSLTGLFLTKGIRHPWRGSRRPVGLKTKELNWLELDEISLRNIQGQSLKFPLGRLVMVAGPSGAGKSTLFRDLLNPAISYALKEGKKKLSGKELLEAGGLSTENQASASAPFSILKGYAELKTVIEVDQSPIGKTPRSTPATYLGIFDTIRGFFASLPEAKMRGFSASRFSFNTAGGRCPECEGAGRIKLEMAFMPDTYLPCDSCKGSRYASELDDLVWNGRNIGQVLKMTFEEAVQYFSFHTQLQAICQLMVDCGLGYLSLGQSSPTLSGGEAQRLKLITELSKGLQSYKERTRGVKPQHLYLLEEPTIGLHLSDCEKLIKLLHGLVDQGHSVVVIEHHLDLLAEADWLIELGPGGGPEGGKILYQGEIAGLLKRKTSPTGPYLAAKLR